MKKITYFIATPLFALFLGSCNGGDRAADNADGITEFEINQRLLTGDKAYRVETGEAYGTVYLELSTSVQWPEKMGANDIKVLQDSIVRIAYADTSSTSIRECVKHFITNTSIIDEAANVSEVDSFPSDSVAYFSSVTAAPIEINEDMVTYQIVNSMYLGGAHPMTATIPFTYNFAQGKVIGIDDIFVPDTPTDSIVGMITEALARQLNVAPERLDQAGIFTNQLTYPGRPYIVNNTLYFHYDPYEISPYAMGPIDVAIYPSEVDNIIRPEIKALFD